jgi:hypothetical protein
MIFISNVSSVYYHLIEFNAFLNLFLFFGFRIKKRFYLNLFFLTIKFFFVSYAQNIFRHKF